MRCSHDDEQSSALSSVLANPLDDLLDGSVEDSLSFLHSSYTFTQNFGSSGVFLGMPASLAALISSSVLGGGKRAVPADLDCCTAVEKPGSDAEGCVVEEGRAEWGWGRVSLVDACAAVPGGGGSCSCSSRGGGAAWPPVSLATCDCSNWLVAAAKSLSSSGLSSARSSIICDPSKSSIIPSVCDLRGQEPLSPKSPPASGVPPHPPLGAPPPSVCVVMGGCYCAPSNRLVRAP